MRSEARPSDSKTFPTFFLCAWKLYKSMKGLWSVNSFSAT